MSIVFYSWQSDLPNATNRGFIQKALENAAKSIRDDDSIQVEPVVDRDTSGVPGSPDIARTIFEKIEESQVFVCDVSIINQSGESRPTPNPNVLIELGYALKTLGSERILMVLNKAYGAVELLPFDLRLKRVTDYYMPEDRRDRATERKELEGKLEAGLRIILDGLDGQVEEHAVARFKRYIADDTHRILLHDLVAEEVEKVCEATGDEHFPTRKQDAPFSPQALVDRITRYEEIVETLISFMIHGCYWGSKRLHPLWVRSLQRIANAHEQREGLALWKGNLIFLSACL